MEKNNKKIIVAIVIAIFFVLASLSYLAIKNKQAQILQTKNPPVSKQQEIPISGNFWTGAVEPKITIVEFFDFKCSYCQSSYSKIRRLGIKYKDLIKIVLKDYPLHEGSMELAMAARCAGEQNLFWEMHDKLFTAQDGIKTSEIENIASSIGADKKTFSSCLSLQKYQKEILTDMQDGQKLSIEGTPTFFINGYRLSGDLPIEQWEKIIKLLLEQN